MSAQPRWRAGSASDIRPIMYGDGYDVRTFYPLASVAPTDVLTHPPPPGGGPGGPREVRWIEMDPAACYDVEVPLLIPGFLAIDVRFTSWVLAKPTLSESPRGCSSRQTSEPLPRNKRLPAGETPLGGAGALLHQQTYRCRCSTRVRNFPARPLLFVSFTCTVIWYWAASDVFLCGWDESEQERT